MQVDTLGVPQSARQCMCNQRTQTCPNGRYVCTANYKLGLIISCTRLTNLLPKLHYDRVCLLLVHYNSHAPMISHLNSCMQAKLKVAETTLAEHNLSSPSSSASIHPAAAAGDVPVMPTSATPSALASSVPPAIASSLVSAPCSAAQSLGAVQLQRQPSSSCW